MVKSLFSLSFVLDFKGEGEGEGERALLHLAFTVYMLQIN